MKKFFLGAFALTFSLTIFSCTGNSKPVNDVQGEAVAEEIDAEAEAAVVAYEEWLVKYEDIMNRSAKGEDVIDELMVLNLEQGPKISENLIKTEGQRNAEQKARVKIIEDKVDSIKKANNLSF